MLGVTHHDRGILCGFRAMRNKHNFIFEPKMKSWFIYLSHRLFTKGKEKKTIKHNPKYITTMGINVVHDF